MITSLSQHCCNESQRVLTYRTKFSQSNSTNFRYSVKIPFLLQLPLKKQRSHWSSQLNLEMLKYACPPLPAAK